jgi:hypothetical protein
MVLPAGLGPMAWQVRSSKHITLYSIETLLSVDGSVVMCLS